jgi:small subunit ribosomal protein S3e
MSKKRKVRLCIPGVLGLWVCGFLPILANGFCFWRPFSSVPEQFVADGVFFAELNELLTRELAEDGYSGVEVRVTPMRTEIIIRATRTQNVLGRSWDFVGTLLGSSFGRSMPILGCWVLVNWRGVGEKGRRIRELTSVVQKRFQFPEGTVELYAEKVNNRGLCAIAQAESLRYKLLGGLAVRRCDIMAILIPIQPFYVFARISPF